MDLYQVGAQYCPFALQRDPLHRVGLGFDFARERVELTLQVV